MNGHLVYSLKALNAILAETLSREGGLVKLKFMEFEGSAEGLGIDFCDLKEAIENDGFFEMKGDALSQVDIELTFLKAVDIEVSLSYLSGNVLRIEIFDSSEIEVTPHGERFFVDSSHQLINDANSQVMARAKGETKEGGSDKGARPL